MPAETITPTDLAERALRMARKGMDVRTIWFHFEAVLERKLSDAEGQALQDAWRAAGPERAERHHREMQRRADEAKAQRNDG